MKRRLLAAAALVAIAAACGGSSTASTTAGSTVDATTTFPADPLAGFERGVAVVSGEEWAVAIADENHERVQGLMGVADLGDLDGMLFVWDDDTVTTFWMKDTLVPLDIAFFAADGTLVDLFPMIPCPAEPCPHYGTTVPFRYALEAPLGAFEAIDQPFLEYRG